MATKKIEIQDSNGNVYYPHTDASVVKNGSKTVAEQLNDCANNLSQLSNSNILINGNFKNPINQRKLASYNSAGYSIDRWRLSGDGVELKVSNGFITLTVLSETNGCECEQFIEFPSELSGKSVTISFKYKTTSKSLKLFVHSFEKGNIGNIQNDKLIKDGNWHEVSTTINVPILTTDNKFKIGFQFFGEIHKGEVVDIEYIKLELGSIATPFVPRMYAEELALCQRYYFRNRWNTIRTALVGNNQIRTCAYYYPVQMRIAPTIKNLVSQPINEMYTSDLTTHIIPVSTDMVASSPSIIYNDEMCDFQFNTHNVQSKDYILEIKDYAYEFDAEIY